jgi:hypothetical protein
MAAGFAGPGRNLALGRKVRNIRRFERKLLAARQPGWLAQVAAFFLCLLFLLHCAARIIAGASARFDRETAEDELAPAVLCAGLAAKNYMSGGQAHRRRGSFLAEAIHGYFV